MTLRPKIPRIPKKSTTPALDDERWLCGVKPTEACDCGAKLRSWRCRTYQRNMEPFTAKDLA